MVGVRNIRVMGLHSAVKKSFQFLIQHKLEDQEIKPQFWADITTLCPFIDKNKVYPNVGLVCKTDLLRGCSEIVVCLLKFPISHPFGKDPTTAHSKIVPKILCKDNPNVRLLTTKLV